MKLEMLHRSGDAVYSHPDGSLTVQLDSITEGGSFTFNVPLDASAEILEHPKLDIEYLGWAHVKDIVPGHPLWAAAYPTARDRRNRE
jgi:hypothetical protein